MNKLKEYIKLKEENVILKKQDDENQKNNFEIIEDYLLLSKKEYLKTNIKELKKQKKQERFVQFITMIIVPAIILFFTILELMTGVNVNFVQLLIADIVSFSTTGLIANSSTNQMKKINQEILEKTNELNNTTEKTKTIGKTYEELNHIRYELYKQEIKKHEELLENKRKLEELKTYILNNMNIKTLNECIKIKKKAR